MTKAKGLLRKTSKWINTCLIMLLVVLPSTSQATSIESILNKTHSYLSGSVARSLGLVVIVISGYLCIFRQELPKETFAMILVGFGIIFGASSLYSTLIQ